SSGIPAPEWHFRVEDDHTPAANIVVNATLTNVDTTTTLKTFAVPFTNGAGYNRAVSLSTALAPELGVQSGTYKLSLTATDLKGNASTPTVVSWTQTIRVPPIRVAPGPDCSSVDSECPYYYTLSGDNKNASLPLKQYFLLKLAHAVVDNP